MPRPVTTHQRRDMRSLRRQGVPEREIARRFDRALTTVQRHVGDLPPLPWPRAGGRAETDYPKPEARA